MTKNTNVFAKVINGEIVENNRTLPFSIEVDDKTVSLSVYSTNEELAEYGYLPVVGTQPMLEANQRVNGVSYVVGADEVTKVYDVVIVSDEELFKLTVPKTITPRQARLVLLGAGLLDDIEVLLATDKAMQIWWEYSLEVDRDNAHIVTAGTALGLTELQLDEMFIAASKL